MLSSHQVWGIFQTPLNPTGVVRYENGRIFYSLEEDEMSTPPATSLEDDAIADNGAGDRQEGEGIVDADGTDDGA